MEASDARTILVNLKQRYAKQWTRTESDAFETALNLLDIRVRENEQQIAKLHSKR